MIPRTIHIVALNRTLPMPIVQSIQSWQDNAGPFTVEVWDRQRIEAAFPRMIDVLLPMRVLSNFLRVRILHEFGGVHFDADTYAQPGAGAALDIEVGAAELVACTIDGLEKIDNTPMGTVPGAAGWEQLLTSDPARLIEHWHAYLAERDYRLLDGEVWSADAAGTGVRVVHDRFALRRHDPLEKIRRGKASTEAIRMVSGADLKRNRVVRRIADEPATIVDRAELLSLVPAGDAVEVGTHLAAYADVIAAAVSGHVTCVDPYRPSLADYVSDEVQRRDREADYAAAQQRLRKYGARISFLRLLSLEAVPLFADESLSLVYIDANHAAGYLARDLAAWWPKLKPGGLLAGHDLTGQWAREVRPTVEAFALLHGLTFNRTADQPASWFIRKEAA